MPEIDFQHIRVSMVNDVALVEIRTREFYDPASAQELGAELGQVASQEWAGRLLVTLQAIFLCRSSSAHQELRDSF